MMSQLPRSRAAALPLALLILTSGGAAQMAAHHATQWDTFSDTWVATDALGRTLPAQEGCGPPLACAACHGGEWQRRSRDRSHPSGGQLHGNIVAGYDCLCVEMRAHFVTPAAEAIWATTGSL